MAIMFDFVKNIWSSRGFALYMADDFVQVMELSNDSKTGIKIAAYNHVVLEEGIIVNGEIIKGQALAKVIKLALSQAKPRPIKETKCFVVIPENQLYERVFVLPPVVPGQQDNKVIEALIKGSFPFGDFEYKYDYKILTFENNVRYAFVVAVKRLVVAQYYETVKQFCTLKPALLEPEHSSLLRNMASLRALKSDVGTIVIDCCKNEFSWFVVYKKMVFDVTTFSIADLKNNESLISAELQKVADLLTQMTSKPVQAIVLSGDATNTELVKAFLININNQLPVIVNNKFAVGNESFRVIGGLGLLSIGFDGYGGFDLFKK